MPIENITPREGPDDGSCCAAARCGAMPRLSLLRWRDGHPDKTMTDDDPVNSTSAERDAGDDPVRTRVDTEDRRVDRRAVPRENAFGRYPDGAGAERDSDGGQR